MTKYLIPRLLQAVVTLVLMSMLVFSLARLTGNPLDLMLSPYATPEQQAAMAREMGFDQPLAKQYWNFLVDALHGDLGESLYYKRSTASVVAERFGATAELGIIAIVLSLLIAIPLGVFSAVNRDTPIDLGGKTLAVLGQSVPNFWLGILLIEFVAVRWDLLPAGGRDGFLGLLLPAITLGWFMTAGIMRVTRSAMLDVLDAEYVKLARVKGVPEKWVVWKHALRNALIPVVTFAGIIFAQLLVGSIIVEHVFAWPGLGRLAYEAVVQRDFPLLQTIVLVFTMIYIGLNLIVDLTYAWLDPRIRL
ncbi:MAG: ABC transporter permease [Alphaproteobacteria bacterium]|nr:ABC transporter permease [Alphaproteobacteria bacterium]